MNLCNVKKWLPMQLCVVCHEQAGTTWGAVAGAPPEPLLSPFG